MVKIIRDDLVSGESQEMGRWDGITTSTAHFFMINIAQAECDNIVVSPDINSGRSTVKISNKRGHVIVKFRQEWE